MAVVFYLPGKVGGVLSVTKAYAHALKENGYQVRVIFYSTLQERHKGALEFLDPDRLLDVIEYKYSLNDNLYYVQHDLKEFIKSEGDIIVCNEGLELGMFARFKLQNPCLVLLHGDYAYYYNNGIFAAGFASFFLAVSPVIVENIQNHYKQLVSKTQLIRYITANPARSKDLEALNSRSHLNIIFIGRLSKAKGFDILSKIASATTHLPLKWVVVGRYVDAKPEDMEWLTQQNVTYYDNLPNEQIQIGLAASDVLILPSLAEGYPVSVVEAMKNGVVPLVNDIAGIAPDIIIDQVSGIRIKNNVTELYVKSLESLVNDRQTLMRYAIAAKELAAKTFNNEKSIAHFTELLGEATKMRFEKKFPVVSASKLDRRFLPRTLVKFIRSLASIYK